MKKLLTNLVIASLIATGIFVYRNSQRTFEAKFKNIDGLPIGAPVTALGVKVGEVIRTRPLDDGVSVTIKITNMAIPKPPPGSLLTITSLKPAQARTLEIIPPDFEATETKAWLVREPITTESWLHASLELLDGLKRFSEATLKVFTPENLKKARTSISAASDTLSDTAENMRKYEEELASITKRLSLKADEANRLVNNLQHSLASLNTIMENKDIAKNLKDNLETFSANVAEISMTVSKPDFISSVSDVKTMIIDQLNQANSVLADARKNIKDPALLENIKNFNSYVTRLNEFYKELDGKEAGKFMRDKVSKGKELATKASEFTGMVLKQN